MSRRDFRAEDSLRLRVISLFLSIDGEVNGCGQGTPAFFIRLAGCNLRCWQERGGCDTPYSFGSGEEMPVGELLRRVEASGCPKVTLTGGEPLLQRGPALAALLEGLAARKVAVSVETNGTLPPDFAGREHVASLVYDYKCPSSGCEAAMLPFEAMYAALGPSDYIKFIIADEADYACARDKVLRARELAHAGPRLAFSSFLPALPGGLTPQALVARLLAERLFEVQYNLQIHKFIWPDAETDI